MRTRFAHAFAAGLAAAATFAAAQQPAPPPSFAAPNVSGKGVRSMVTACAMCHGTNGRTASGSSVAHLAGRPAAEMVAVMKSFKDGTRQATVMHQIAKGYSDAEIAAIAEFFAGQVRQGEGRPQ